VNNVPHCSEAYRAGFDGQFIKSRSSDSLPIGNKAGINAFQIDFKFKHDRKISSRISLLNVSQAYPAEMYRSSDWE
jgi:hypothetical protein